MNLNAASILAPTLGIGANRDQIITALGEPQDAGAGLRGFTLLAYRERTIQCTFRADGLFLLAFYFRTPGSEEWPECLAALADFSSETKPGEVEGWLGRRDIPVRRMSVCDEVVIEAPDGVRFYFESGQLSSIQIISVAPVPDSARDPLRGAGRRTAS